MVCKAQGRYEAILHREWYDFIHQHKKAVLGAANTQDGTVEQKSEIPSVSTSNDTEN